MTATRTTSTSAVAAAGVVEDRQALADPRRAALELPLARERDAGRARAGQQLLDLAQARGRRRRRGRTRGTPRSAVRQGASGIVAVSVVPRRSGLSTVSRPPSDSTRAARPCRPVPRVAQAPPRAVVGDAWRRACGRAARRPPSARSRRACLIAFESASETRNQIVVSTTAGRRRSGSASIRSGSGDWAASAASAPRRPRSSPTGCRPAGQLAQLAAGHGRLLARRGEALERLLGVASRARAARGPAPGRARRAAAGRRRAGRGRSGGAPRRRRARRGRARRRPRPRARAARARGGGARARRRRGRRRPAAPAARSAAGPSGRVETTPMWPIARPSALVQRDREVAVEAVRAQEASAG